ncbi:MauE/DoxX family redox-associated membrane protein [Phycicoccus duodecadis]|uniref:Methylamine utilization protein MauE n=1 Tax=Phycicoccus duodecadis TaxID=173053 RepID=A0A2N3YMQ6_9MICO|nr:MauE/DoxX family redox-associated membrane protein [Phycicoccus duodecadis]PKW28132.1 methylamine utilization protein MauE [Phycicoccus duodecadis]
MPSALLLPLLTCSVVLWVSGAAKLRDPASLERAVASLAVPAPFDGRAARRLLPWAEVALGLWLLVATGVWLVVVTFAVLVLFGTYLALVARAQRGPEAAECGCFGALGDQRVTTATVARNALLVVAAASGVVAALRDVSVLTALLAGAAAWGWLAAAALTAGIAALVTWRAPDDAGGGVAAPTAGDEDEYLRTPVPDVQLLTEEGELVLLGSRARFAAQLLVFLSPGCGACLRVAPLVPGWAERLAPVEVHAVLLGEAATVGAHPELRGHVWFDPHRVAHRALAPSTPSAVLVGTDALLAGGPVLGEQGVLAFVDEVLAHLEQGLTPLDPEDVSGVR